MAIYDLISENDESIVVAEFENGFFAAEVTKKSFVITDADIVAGRGEGIPGNVQPARTRQQLVGVLPRFEEVHERLELRWVFRSDVGSLAKQVLRVLHTAHPAVHIFVTETRIDDDGANDESRWLQQTQASVGQVYYILHRWYVLRIFLQIKKLRQFEVRREFCVIEFCVHGIVSL